MMSPTTAQSTFPPLTTQTVFPFAISGNASTAASDTAPAPSTTNFQHLRSGTSYLDYITHTDDLKPFYPR